MKKKSVVDVVVGPFDVMAGFVLVCVVWWMFSPPNR